MSSSSPPAGGGVGSYLSLFWCDCSVLFPGFSAACMQLATLLGFHTLLTPVGCPTPAVGV